VAAVAAVAVVAMLSVQGCDAGTAAQAETDVHDVTISQAQSVYQTYLTSSDTAAQQGNATTGLADVADAQWEILHGQYTALAASKIPVPRYQYGTPTFYVPGQEGYPHWFVVSVPRHQVGQVGSEASATTLMVFGQVKAGTNWLLDGTTALQPGQRVPAIPVDATGYATALSTRDPNLLLPPDVVGATQAAVVDDGPASVDSRLVEDSPDTTGLYATQSAAAATEHANGLNYSWQMLGAAFPVFALKLTDGGALVLYGLYLNTINEHGANPTTGNAAQGAPIPVPSDFVPLTGPPVTEAGDHAVSANWTYQYAAIDPSGSASNAKISVIAATGGPSYAHAY